MIITFMLHNQNAKSIPNCDVLFAVTTQVYRHHPVKQKTGVVMTLMDRKNTGIHRKRQEQGRATYQNGLIKLRLSKLDS